MIRWLTTLSVCCLLMAALPGDLLAQFSPDAARSNPSGSGADPRARRAVRERAVAILGGSGSREFVESCDEAVAALFACSRPVAVKLVEFHASGELGKLPRPSDLLRVIAQPRHGDDVAIWAIQHGGELRDTDSFDAYLQTPLEIAIGLKKLEVGAAEVRAHRLSQASTTTTTTTPLAAASSTNDKWGIAACVGVAVIVGLLIWRYRQKSAIA